MSELPKLAVIIPVYKVATYLAEVLESVVSQAYPGLEVVVVDDGSPAAEAAAISAICRQFTNVTLLAQPHSTAARARHTGVEHTACEYIVFLDADDRMTPGSLAFLAQTLRKHPQAVASYARKICVDAKGEATTAPRPAIMAEGREVLQQILQHKTPFCNGTICMRRAALLALPHQHHALVLGEDWVLWCHLAFSGEIVPAGGQVVMHYRIHDQNTSHRLVEEYALVLEAFAMVFTDPKFIAAVGVQEMQQLHARCASGIHAYLASRAAVKKDMVKAQYHFSQVSVPLSPAENSWFRPDVIDEK